MAVPSELESMQMEKLLKESIIDHAKALFSIHYPIGLIWSVVLERHGEYSWYARVIVHASSTITINHTIVERSERGEDRKAALEDLLEMLQMKLKSY